MIVTYTKRFMGYLSLAHSKSKSTKKSHNQKFKLTLNRKRVYKKKKVAEKQEGGIGAELSCADCDGEDLEEFHLLKITIVVAVA